MTETRRVVRPPTAATMPFDGGHPALELVNTIYGQVGRPPEHDVLATPEDLLTITRRLGFADETTPPSARALAQARALRAVVDALLRARVAGVTPPADALAGLERAVRAALAAGRLRFADGALGWTWDATDAQAPVCRLAQAALELLSDEAELARLRQCEACCWLFVDHSRGAGRRWCSMADCGTEAKKRRYIERRRERRRKTP